MNKRGIAFKLNVLILGILIAILAFMVIHNHGQITEFVFKSVRENARNLSFANLNKIEAILKSVETAPEHIAYSLEHLSLNKDELLTLSRQVVESNHAIFGSTIAFEPYKFDSKLEYFAPYFFKKDGKTKFTYIGGDDYKYFSWDWYRLPKESQISLWTEPYFDEGAGDIIMSTYSVPFYKESEGKREMFGVVTADISLSQFTEIVSSMKVSPSGYAFLISKNGTFITYPQKKYIMNKTIFSLADLLEDPSLREIGQKMVNGESTFISNESLFPGQKSWLFINPITANGWSMAVVFPEADVFAEINKTKTRVFIVSTISLIIMFISIILISRTITRPLRELSDVTDKIAEGDLNVPIPESKSGDEIGRLTNSYIHMRDNLKTHINEVTQLTAEKERIESELKFAALVQQGFLPQTLPQIENYEFGAVTVPSKYVGGDFYDLLPLKDGKFGLFIGDVSGKGVSAALYMAQLLSDFRHLSQIETDPAKVISDLNNILYKRSSHGMFASALFISIDIEKKIMSICNAGHFPLAIRSQNGEIQQFGTEGEIPLGILPDRKYTNEQVSLNAGDMGLLYTDGAVEAQNNEHEHFSYPRIASILEKEIDDTPEDLINHLQQAIEKFINKAPTHDDMTFLSFQLLRN
jgi:sigma-B regulation protein RsbU (phosphoserine phosphatase)